MNLVSTLVLCFIITVLLTILTALNLDAFSRNVKILGYQSERMDGSPCCAIFSEILMIVLLISDCAFFLSMVFNGITLVQRKCSSEAIIVGIDGSYEDLEL